MAHRLIAAAAMLCAALAQAQLTDPTRPAGAAAAPGTAANGLAESSVPVLQSVKLPRKGAASAVIGGRLVRVGEQVGEARLVRLSETQAVLEGPAGRTVLELNPNISKRSAAQPRPKAQEQARD
jgi:MSHA biogenesis protein MshK